MGLGCRRKRRGTAALHELRAGGRNWRLAGDGWLVDAKGEFQRPELRGACSGRSLGGGAPPPHHKRWPNLRHQPQLQVLHLSEKKLFTLFTWTGYVQPGVREWASNEKGKNGKENEILPGHVGAGTGGDRRAVGAEQTVRDGAEIQTLGETVADQRIHHAPRFPPRAEAAFTAIAWASVSGPELASTRDSISSNISRN